MGNLARERPLDGSDALYEMGRLVQGVALAMRRHQVVDAQQVCQCGRPPERTVQVFGPRCEIAAEQWEHACQVLRRFLQLTARTDGAPGKAIGRARVRRVRRGGRWPA